MCPETAVRRKCHRTGEVRRPRARPGRRPEPDPGPQRRGGRTFRLLQRGTPSPSRWAALRHRPHLFRFSRGLVLRYPMERIANVVVILEERAVSLTGAEGTRAAGALARGPEPHTRPRSRHQWLRSTHIPRDLRRLPGARVLPLLPEG